jgi:hypothetical protein
MRFDSVMRCQPQRVPLAVLSPVKAQERHQVVTSVVFNDILTVIPSTADLALAHWTDGILFQTLPHSGNSPRMRPLLSPANE